jgi:hypothetical protein
LRGCDRARDFLDAVWSVPLDDDNIGWWDNSAVLRLLGWSLDRWPPTREFESAWVAGTQWLPEEWNRTTTWNRDWRSARVHHVAGERFALRVTQMQADVHHLAGHRLRSALLRLPWRLTLLLRGSTTYARAKARVADASARRRR